MITMRWHGAVELQKKFEELTDREEQSKVLKAGVRAAMKDVSARAKVNISKFSPGKTELHKTYRGRLVSAGFAMRSIRFIVVLDKTKEAARAILGVRKEAFYALQFWELGTAYLQALPWLQPAFYSSKDESVKKVGEKMRERIEKIAKKRSADAA